MDELETKTFLGSSWNIETELGTDKGLERTLEYLGQVQKKVEQIARNGISDLNDSRYFGKLEISIGSTFINGSEKVKSNVIELKTTYQVPEAYSALVESAKDFAKQVNNILKRFEGVAKENAVQEVVALLSESQEKTKLLPDDLALEQQRLLMSSLIPLASTDGKFYIHAEIKPYQRG